ncbi:Sodium/proton antiporter [Vigna angularis]|uniref:Sodium/proton antiporter n=1 Tax=Phaseolus angularis TaxID=3914 RepID=A0A8T0KMN7_PHAAN|nr:Sodium/proton antiporter [Vigna angularis]
MEKLLVGISVCIMLLLLNTNNNTVQGFQHQKQQHSFRDLLILPPDYVCSQYTVETKDGLLLGLESVFSSSVGVVKDGEAPLLLLLLLRGLFMDLAMHDFAEMTNYINSVRNTKLFVLQHSQGKMSFAVAFTQLEIPENFVAASKDVQKLNHRRTKLRGARVSTVSSFQSQPSAWEGFQTVNARIMEMEHFSNVTKLLNLLFIRLMLTLHCTLKMDLAMALVFVIGYVVIIFEEYLAFNKSGVGLLMAVSLWVIRSIGAPSTDIEVSELTHASAQVSEIVFFLLAAMTIVEIIDAHRGFKLVTDNITTQNPRLLLWVFSSGQLGIYRSYDFSIAKIVTSIRVTEHRHSDVSVNLLSFLFPAFSDYLEVQLVHFIIYEELGLDSFDRILGAVVVIAANAGGAWSPIGAVTTTMLWIHGFVYTFSHFSGCSSSSDVPDKVDTLLHTLQKLASKAEILIFSLTYRIWITLVLNFVFTSIVNDGKGQNSLGVFSSEESAPQGLLVFSLSLGALLFVPVLRALTGLPPYMGMLLGLGMLWIVTDVIHYGDSERQKLKVPHALSRIDTQGALFFLGILLSVSSLEAAGILQEIANYFDAHVPSSELIASAIGLISAVIDNVPLVAATMGMYDVSAFPQDSEFWQLIALCASTGGSILIAGSAAGVAFMGMEKVNFCWYLRKVTGFALAGYAAGIAAYLVLHKLRI